MGSWSAIFWSGFVASILAACAFWLFRSFGWTRFSPGTQLGCLFYREPGVPLTETVGFLLFLLLGVTLVPAAYAVAMRPAGGAGWGSGLLVGLLHGLATVAVLPLLARFDACVREGRLPEPGRFGLGWGRATPAAVLTGHLVYGGILGGLLAAF